MIAGELVIHVPGERDRTWLFGVLSDIGASRAIEDHIRVAKKKFPRCTSVDIVLHDNELAKRR